MATVTEKTKLPLSLVILLSGLLVGLAGSTTVTQYQVHDHDRKLERSLVEVQEHDKRIQRVEDSGVVLKDILLEMKQDLKDVKRDMSDIRKDRR